MRKKTIILGLYIAATTAISAQSTHINFDELQGFRKAKLLYLTETYEASQDKFEKVLAQKNLNTSDKEAAEFYASLVGLVNQERGAEERFLAFEKKYPRSIYMQNAHWELGGFYLSGGDYQKAYTYLSQGNLYDLPERKRNAYQFKLGYAAFMLGKNKEALRHLEPLVHSETYQDEAAYYVGHIYYAAKDFEQAFKYFDALRARNPTYDQRVLPYVVQIEFNRKAYDKTIEDGKALLANNNDAFVQSEVSKIVGESYFKLKAYNEAIPYLEAYQGEKTNADYYQLGYAYYQKGEFDTAISLLNKIVSEKNALAQTAYYQLGNAYLQTEHKQQALTAYKSAAEMLFNPQISEDAFYNYAKLSYEIGNPFAGTPEVLQAFGAKYPQSKYTAEINQYLVDAYISSGNYKNALEVLSTIHPKNQTQKDAEQKTAFLYGVNLLKDGDITSAQPYFELATQQGSDQTIKSRAMFWLGESLYRQGKYKEALSYFERFDQAKIALEESHEIKYQLGYTYLKMREYPEAIRNFEAYLASNPPGDFGSDAKLRLADAFIGNQETAKALKLYRELAKQEPDVSDEAAYNGAIALGILGETEQKIEALESFIQQYPVSPYHDGAQYELSLAYTLQGENAKALNHLDKLIKNADLEMASRARLQKGVIYNNQTQTQKALQEFKTVAESYPNTSLALDAIESAKRIYLEQNKLNDFEKWANSLGYYTVDQSELELLAFTSAQDIFEKKEYAQAITLYTAFNQKYPSSGYSAAVNYNLGESYYQTSKYEQAEAPLMQVAKTNSEYKEDAMLRLAQIYLSQKKTTQALLLLENLNQITQNTSYKTYTEIHLMRLYSQSGNHEKAVTMAKRVLANPKNEATVLQEAELTQARSLMATNQVKEAKAAFEKLEKSSSDAIKAEALYYKSYFLHQEKQYVSSNDVVFHLASSYAAQQYWGSKALVLMASNYYHLGDLYQANTTIDAVIQNYQDYPEVIADAKALKQQISAK